MLRYMTAGESHGKGMMVVLDGVPAGLPLSAQLIDLDLQKRMYGYGRGKRMAIEKDSAEIMAGCRKGITIGSPIGIFVKNMDCVIDKLPSIKCPRPGHADLAGIQKYGLNDARNVLERASARETVVRVAAGAVAKLILEQFKIRTLSHVTMLGGVKAETCGLSFDELLKLLGQVEGVRCADKKAEKLMCKEIDNAREKGDTLGGSFELIAEGIPPGLGSYAQWDRRLDGAIARAIMAIPAVKAVSIGKGFECSGKRGSQTHDPITYNASEKAFGRSSNNAGGIEGGVTNGMPVVITGFMKPIATLGSPLASVDIDTKAKAAAAVERADICALDACAVVAQSVTALELASAFLDKFGGDSIAEIDRNYKAYMEQLKKI